MKRSVVVFLTLFLLWTLTSHVNHAISGWNVSLFLGGLHVALAGLRLPRQQGLCAVIGAGLLHDASAPFIGLLDFGSSDPGSIAPVYSGSPVWFGAHAFLFAAAHSLVFHYRSRVPREELLVGVLAALLSNLGIFLGISFVALARAPSGVDAWPRLFLDLVISQTLLALIAPWFLALQARSLEIAGVDLRAEERGLR